MDVTFTEEQDALRAAVADLLADHSDRAHVREVFLGARGTDPDLWQRLLALGVGELPGMVELGIVAEECGRTLAPVPLVPALGIAGAALQVLADGGSSEAADLLAAVRTGEAVVVPSLQLPTAETVGNAVDVPAATHVLHLDRGSFHALSLEGGSVTVHSTVDRLRRLGSAARDNAATVTLGPIQPALDEANRRGTVIAAHELVGVAQACLDMAVEHAKSREQFGKPIGVYQAISHRCADMFVALEAARSLAYFAAWAIDADDQTSGSEAEGHSQPSGSEAGGHSDQAEVAASQAKAAAGDAAIFCAESCIQVHGGIGFTWEHDTHLYLKRAWSASALLGTPRDHRRKVADLIGL